jgi:dihydroneopterin aldolase
VSHQDRIRLSGLRARGYHGVLAAERARGQEFIVDAVLWLDTSAAADADDVARTVDYGSLAGRLADVISGEPVALIETLAQRLAAVCLTDDVVQHAEITVHKPQAPVGVPVRDVSITIWRSRDPGPQAGPEAPGPEAPEAAEPR